MWHSRGYDMDAVLQDTELGEVQGTFVGEMYFSRTCTLSLRYGELSTLNAHSLGRAQISAGNIGARFWPIRNIEVLDAHTQ